MKAPLILEIKGNSLDDGPGIRSVVFFKGCPLSCRWCHNPESKYTGPELGFEAEDCIACDTCMETCPESALSRNNPFFVDRERCSLCFACVDTCPSGALSRVGKPMTVDDILQATLKDKTFFDNSGGGVTLSGGEPTLFPDFTSELLKAFKKAGVHTLVETCGRFDLKGFKEKIHPFIDLIYYDIKLMDAGVHAHFCGVPNHRILANFRDLIKQSRDGFAEVLPRTPLIPGITDTQQNLSGIAEFLAECHAAEIQLLPYHPLWQTKNRKIGRKDSLESHAEMQRFLSPQELFACRDIFEATGIRVQT